MARLFSCASGRGRRDLIPSSSRFILSWHGRARRADGQDAGATVMPGQLAHARGGSGQRLCPPPMARAIVAWVVNVADGGLTGAARSNIAHKRFSIRVWEAADVVDAVLETYEDLPEDIRADLTLKPIWVLTAGE